MPDAADAGSLYATLEEEIASLLYDRDDAGVLKSWVGMMEEP